MLFYASKFSVVTIATIIATCSSCFARMQLFGAQSIVRVRVVFGLTVHVHARWRLCSFDSLESRDFQYNRWARWDIYLLVSIDGFHSPTVIIDCLLVWWGLFCLIYILISRNVVGLNKQVHARYETKCWVVHGRNFSICCLFSLFINFSLQISIFSFKSVFSRLPQICVHKSYVFDVCR